MKQFIAFIIKEAKHILRDTRTILILFVMPVVLMLIFGFAVSTDVRDVRTVIVSSSQDYATQKVIVALSQSEYFNICYAVPAPCDAERLIRNQKADIAIVFSADFASKHEGVQIITDGADPNMAQQYSNYAMQIIASQMTKLKAINSLNAKLLYNPELRSSYNFVPGIMGMLLLLICAMMTSISIVKEKERGTMEVLLVSPIRSLYIIIAKAVPYMILAFCVLITILVISRFILAVPLGGNIIVIILLSSLYILLALSLGLLISTIANTQLVALLVSAIVLLMPSVLLSGMMFPIESMPIILQYISAIMPPRYYISAMRKLMIMGADVRNVLYEMAVLGGMTFFILTVALLKFNKRLE